MSTSEQNKDYYRSPEYYASKEYQEHAMMMLGDMHVGAYQIMGAPLPDDAERFVDSVWRFWVDQEWWGEGNENQLTHDDARRLLLVNP